MLKFFMFCRLFTFVLPFASSLALKESGICGIYSAVSDLNRARSTSGMEMSLGVEVNETPIAFSGT